MPSTRCFSAISTCSVAIYTWLTEAVTLVANVLIYPISTIAIVVMYFDLRVRKEAFDVAMLVYELPE